MPYCFKCGVEVNNGVKNCPLCDFDLPVFEDEKIIEPRYPSQENVFREIKKRRRNVFFTIYSLIILSIAFNLFLIDMKNDELTWSKYAITFMVGSLVYMIVFLQYFRNLKINFIIIGLNTLALLCASDSFDGKIDWFFRLGLPITIISVISLYDIFVIFLRKRLLPYKIMETLLVVGVFLFILELIINIHLFDQYYVSWSLQTVVCFVPVLAILIFTPRRYYEKFDKYIERKLHM